MSPEGQDSNSPFRRKRRLFGFLFDWLEKRQIASETRQFQPSKTPLFFRIVGRLHFIVAESSTMLSQMWAGLIAPVRALMGRLFFNRINEWQLRSEEKRNRTARVSWFSRHLKEFNIKIWLLTERLNKHSVLFRRIFAPVRFIASLPLRISWLIGSGYESLEKKLSESAGFRWIAHLMWAARVGVSSTYEFFHAWFFTRNFWQLPLGLPAILMFVPLAVCMARIPFHTAAKKATHYRVAAMQAAERDDFETVKLCYRKIQQLGLYEEDSVYSMAVTAAEQGNFDEAREQIENLVEQYNFAPARLWLVSHIANGRIATDGDPLSVCQEHLDSVLRLDSENLGAKYLQAVVWMRQGDTDSAIEILRSISRSVPAAKILQSNIQRVTGDIRGADSSLNDLLSQFQSTYDRQAILPANDFLAWASARLVRGDVDGYRETLELALTHHGDDDAAFRRRVANSLRSTAELQRAVAPQASLDMLFRADELDPNSEQTHDRLALMVDDPRFAKQVIEFFASRQREVPTSVLINLGVAAYQQEDFAAARSHFEAVVRQKPDSAGIANNLAWLLAETEPVDLQRAFALAEQATRLEPDNPLYRDTRGQILVKLKRWSEAVTDLEYAANGVARSAETHSALAKAYEQLGDEKLAAAHRDLAQRLD